MDGGLASIWYSQQKVLSSVLTQLVKPVRNVDRVTGER